MMSQISGSKFQREESSVLKSAEILERFLEEPPIKGSLTWLKETLQEVEKLAAPSWRKQKGLKDLQVMLL